MWNIPATPAYPQPARKTPRVSADSSLERLDQAEGWQEDGQRHAWNLCGQKEMVGRDKLELTLGMRCRLLESPRGSNRAGDNHQALVHGPVVLARDENIDPDYNKPVVIDARNGYVDVVAVPPTLPTTRMQFRIPTREDFIQMVDYASVDNWKGKHICTWLPRGN